MNLLDHERMENERLVSDTNNQNVEQQSLKGRLTNAPVGFRSKVPLYLGNLVSMGEIKNQINLFFNFKLKFFKFPTLQ